MNSHYDLIRMHIRDVPDFPKPGIVFKDITPLLASTAAFTAAIELFEEQIRPMSVNGILAIESRGFLFGAPLALRLGIPLSIARKPGKLPWLCDRMEYSLEYGTGALEVHKDSFQSGQRIVVIDDLLATGGTAAAAAQLAAKQGAKVVGCAFVIELAFLKGREKINPLNCFSLITY